MRSSLAFVALVWLATSAQAEPSWSPFAEADVVRIVTQDEDGAERDTPVPSAPTYVRHPAF